MIIITTATDKLSHVVIISIKKNIRKLSIIIIIIALLKSVSIQKRV